MPTSFSNDFGRSKGRPGPIVNVFRSKKDGKRMLQNRCKKMMRNLEASKSSPNPLQILRKPNLCDWRARFGAGGEVRRGQAPPGPAISALIQLFNLKRPAPGGVRRMFFGPKASLGTIFLDFSRFEQSLIFQCDKGASKNSQNQAPECQKEPFT